MDPSGRNEVAAVWLPGTKSDPRSRTALPPLRRRGMSAGADGASATMVPLHMLSAVRTEISALRQQLVEKDRQLEAGRRAVTDADWRRGEAEMRCEAAEGRAEALQSKLVQLQKERSAGQEAVAKASSHDGADVPVPESLPGTTAPQQSKREAEPPPPPLQALRHGVHFPSRQQLLDGAKHMIEEARARALEEATRVGDDEVEHWRPKAWVSSLHEVPDGLAQVMTILFSEQKGG
jgi:hypothetical protein